MKLTQIIFRNLISQPDANRIHDSTGTRWTNQDILDQSVSLSGKLGTVEDNPYIGLILPTSGTAVVAALGVMLSDRIPVFLNFTSSADAIEHAIRKCGIRTVLTSKRFIEHIGIPERKEFTYLEKWDIETTGEAEEKPPSPATHEAAVHIEGLLRGSPISGDTTATVLFSSGSTGTPKGVVLSHDNLISNLESVSETINLRSDDVMMGTLPFFHSFGYMGNFLLPLFSRIPVVCHANPTDAETIGRMVEEFRCTVLFATPTFLQNYIRKCDKQQLKSLRVVIVGAEKLPTSVEKRFADKFGILPVEGYGCTELSPVVSVNVPENMDEFGRECGKPGCVGKPIPGVKVKIVNPENKESVVDGGEGLLLVNGPNVMQRYLDDPERTKQVISDGWYNTGDIAKIDEDGYITITGRISRFSKVAGEMVPHGAIEDEIYRLLGLTGNAVAVTSVTDPVKGEKLMVVHVDLEWSADQIIAELRTRGLPNLWIPKARDFHRVEKLPMLGTGKLDLATIKNLAFTLNNEA